MRIKEKNDALEEGASPVLKKERDTKLLEA
jgi:hypothetical protein